MLETDLVQITCELTSVYRVIVGICAYDEEGNIEHLLQNLVSEQHLGERYKIVIICSGCTDRTPRMVQKFQKKMHT